MIGECEIKWCGQKGVELIEVNENIGDGSWRVSICRECARKLGIKSGDDLPEALTVMDKIGEATNDRDK